MLSYTVVVMGLDGQSAARFDPPIDSTGVMNGKTRGPTRRAVKRVAKGIEEAEEEEKQLEIKTSASSRTGGCPQLYGGAVWPLVIIRTL